VILGNCWIVTMDDAGSEFERGFVRIEDGLIAELGRGEPPAPGEDLGGAVLTPGLVNTHHHLYQTLTRARAQPAENTRRNRARGGAMVLTPLFARARADEVGDAEDRGEGNPPRGARRRDAEGLEVLHLRPGGLRDPRRARVVDGDPERGCHVGRASSGPRELEAKARIRRERRDHRRRELGAALGRRHVGDAHDVGHDHVADREPRPAIRAAGTDEDDSAGTQLRQRRRRAGRRGGHADADGPGGHGPPREPTRQARPQGRRRAQRRELRLEGRENEEIEPFHGAHSGPHCNGRRVSPAFLASVWAADYP